jgi:hypothetical protein
MDTTSAFIWGHGMWPFSEMSLSTASFVGSIANWALLASLVGGVLSTFVIVKTTDVKEEFWAEDRRHSNERIADLSVQAEQLRKDAAEANARTKQAELQLEQLRFPRKLDFDNFKAAVSRIKPTPIEVLFDPNTPDAPSLATNIWVTLAQAKWPVSQHSGPAPIGPPSPENIMGSHGTWVQAAGGGAWGMSVVTNDEPDLGDFTLSLEQLAPGAALTRALMESVIGPASQTNYGRAYGDLPSGRLRIVVGPKIP